MAEPFCAPCPTPFDLLRPVRSLRKSLGLTSNDLAVLTALVSFLSRDDWAKSAHGTLPMTVIFASNAALTERANDLDERTLRRCLGRLASAGLIARKASANGKRFPLRYGGMIRDAFGIDLRPLIARYPQLVTQAQDQARDQEHLRSLRSEALALRAAILNRDDLTDDELATLAEIRNVLRRALLTTDIVADLFARLRSMMVNRPATYCERETQMATAQQRPAPHTRPSGNHLESCEMPASNGQNVRHKESHKKESKDQRQAESTCQTTKRAITKRDPAKMAWTDFTHVIRFFPDEPKDHDNLTSILLQLGNLLRIKEQNLMAALQKTGAGRLLVAFDYLIEKADTIRRPEAYFQRMLGNV